jgi:hypothetical protein
MRILKRNSCSSSVIENQYLIRMMPERTSMRSNSGTERKNSSSSSGAEAHDALDAGAIVPGAVEQHHFAGGRQVRHVALEIPLMALALGRAGQRDDAADARIEPLGDALDGAALAGRVAAFEQHDDLELLVLHPVLQAHEFMLQAEQLAEIDLAVERCLGGPDMPSATSSSSRSSSICISSSSSKLSAISALMRSELVSPCCAMRVPPVGGNACFRATGTPLAGDRSMTPCLRTKSPVRRQCTPPSRPRTAPAQRRRRYFRTAMISPPIRPSVGVCRPNGRECGGRTTSFRLYEKQAGGACG